MPEISIDNLLDDLKRLPEKLIPDNDTSSILANCYQLCKSRINKIVSIRNDDALLSQLYRSLCRDFKEALDKNRDEQRPMMMIDVSALKTMLAAENAEEALVRCAALLHALSLYIEKEMDESLLSEYLIVKTTGEFGGIDFLVTPRLEDLIADSIEDMPRLEKNVSEMLDEYHPPLRLTPLKITVKKRILFNRHLTDDYDFKQVPDFGMGRTDRGSAPRAEG